MKQNIFNARKKAQIKDYLLSFNSSRDMVDKMMEGIHKDELSDYKRSSLADRIGAGYPFMIDPMPNLYFTRDPFATIGTGISLNHMRNVTRSRETLFAKYIFDHHARFKRRCCAKMV